MKQALPANAIYLFVILFPLPCIALQVSGYFSVSDMSASAVISVLLVGFRHLSDDGLGCLILFMEASVLLLLPCM